MNNGKTSIFGKYHNEKGFSLLEVLLAVLITVIILGAGLAVFKYMTDTGSAAAKVAEINSDIQSSVNLIRLDLYRVGGADIIPEVITIGDDTATYWQRNRCISDTGGISNCDSPTASDRVVLKGTKGDGGGYVINPITPGLVNGHSAMSVLFLDEFARDIDARIKSGDSLEVNTSSSDPRNQKKFSTIKEGDLVLIRKEKPIRISLQHVTGAADGGIISFTSDKTGINQDLTSGFGAASEDVKVQLLRRITYFLDTEPTEGNPAWLMRQVNFRQPVQLIPGVMGFQLTYDMIDKSGGPVPFQQVNIAKDTRGSRQAGTKYSISAVDLHTDNSFFDNNPDRTVDIRRVNINIWADSTSPVAPGNNKQVLLDQTARIALRGYGDFLDPDECAIDAYTEDCPCAIMLDDVKAGKATYEELMAEGCPDFCADAMKAEEAERESIIEMGCPDPCDVDVWFAGCPCAVTLQDIKDGKATVEDLAAQGCPDICDGDPFFPTCPCTDDDLKYTSACKYCYDDPWAEGCPCADDPNDPRCPHDLSAQYGKCAYDNSSCTAIRCKMTCGNANASGNQCKLYFGDYDIGPAIEDLTRNANASTSQWFDSTDKSGMGKGSVLFNTDNGGAFGKSIDKITNNRNPKAFWLYFEDTKNGDPGRSNAEHSVPLIWGGSTCDADGKNCSCGGSGTTAFYCDDYRYICKDDGKGGVSIYRRPD